MTTPLMTLTLPTPGVGGTAGPDYATQVNAALTVIDGHDHSSGNGARVTPAGLNINAALEMNDNRLYELGAAVMTSQSAILTGANYLNSLQVVSGELHYRDASGNDVQLTASGALNASSIGGIGGDYATSTAAVTYSSSTKAYSFTQSSGITGDIVGGSLFVYENASSANYVKLSSKASLAANVSLELPSALPSSVTELMTLTTGGVMASTATPTVTSLTTTGGVVAGTTVQTDDVIEKTSGAGVTLDSVLLKDGGVFADHLGNPNAVINGGCIVAQHPAYTLGASSDAVTEVVNGGVDMIGGYTTQTASAGTLTQATSASVGSTGYASHFSGVTLAAGGKLHWVYRMEAKDAARFKGKSASIQVKVYHDIGSAKTATLYLRDADVADVFSATSAISNDGGTSVNDTTATTLKLENVDLSSANPERGLELEVELDCGAITTKNAYLTELQIEEGAVATNFVRRAYGSELEACKRYFSKIVGGGSNNRMGNGYAQNTSVAHIHFQLPVTMRAAPTFSVSSAGDFDIRYAGASRAVNAVATISSQPNGVTAEITVNATVLTAGEGCELADDAGSAIVYFDARL